MYLDEIALKHQVVGYGELGLRGDLGYEDLQVSVEGRCYPHSFSAHAPSCLTFELDGRFASFRCRVGINDDAARGASQGDFLVTVDGRVAAAALCVVAKDAPRELIADITGARRLALTVNTNRLPHCHSVWLDPEVSEQPLCWTGNEIDDCLSRAKVSLPAKPLRAERCIASVVSPGYARLLDNLLGSLRANASCCGALIVVFAIDADDECRRVIAKHGATEITCRRLGPANAALKSVLYSVARVVEAWQYLCLDADTLILGDIRPIFAALEAAPCSSILVCRDAYLSQGNLKRELCANYTGEPGDLSLLLGHVFDEEAYPLVVNDGVFAGSRGALAALDNLIRHMPHAVNWIDQYSHHGWRNQFIFNLALARMNCGVELDPTWNLQLHMRDVQVAKSADNVRAIWQGRPVRVLHFCGWGRNKYPELHGFFAKGC